MINLFFVNFRYSLVKRLRRFPKIGFGPRIDPQIYIGRDPKTSDDELKTSEGLEDHRMFPIVFRRLPTSSHQFSSFQKYTVLSASDQEIAPSKQQLTCSELYKTFSVISQLLAWRFKQQLPGKLLGNSNFKSSKPQMIVLFLRMKAWTPTSQHWVDLEQINRSLGNENKNKLPCVFQAF